MSSSQSAIDILVDICKDIYNYHNKVIKYIFVITSEFAHIAFDEINLIDGLKQLIIIGLLFLIFLYFDNKERKHRQKEQKEQQLIYQQLFHHQQLQQLQQLQQEQQEQEEMELTNKIKKLNDLMKEIRIEIQSDTKNSETLIKGVREDIQYELCRFAKMMVPNIHQKIDEIIEVDDRRTKAKKSSSSSSNVNNDDNNSNDNNNNITKSNSHEKNIRVSDKSNGADLVNDETDEHSEIKVSVLTKEKRCNIMWNIPSGDTILERRNKLIKSAETKTKNGKAYFIIKSKSAVELKRYEFGSLFLQEYFKYYDFNEKSSSINFGCTQCKSCKSFHRLDHIKEEETKFYKDPKAYVAKAKLYDIISSDCNK